MDFFSAWYGKMFLVDTWTNSSGIAFGAFKTYKYGISVNLPMADVQPL
jgi:hypothetical protein